MEKIRKFISENAPLIVAVCAMIITAHQVASTNYHNRISVVPLLIMDISFLKEDMYFSLGNSGNGPLVVRHMEYVSNGKSHRISDVPSLISIMEKENGISFSNLPLRATNFFLGKGIIRPEEKIKILRLDTQNPSPDVQQRFKKILKMLNLNVCFRSLYGDRFFLKNHELKVPEDSCIYEDSFEILGQRFRLKWPWEQVVTLEDAFGPSP